jgi:hypothetical protein
MRSPWAVGLALAALGGCGDGPIEEPLDNRFDQVLVVTSDYQTGAYATVGRRDHRAVRDIRAIHPDATCRTDPLSGQPYLISRLGADAVERLDPLAGWEVALEFSTGAGTNPQDLAVASPGRAYLPLYTRPEVLVVDPRDGTRLDGVDLTPWADADGSPEAASALALEGRVFVTLQRLEDFQPGSPSLLLVLDATSGALLAEVPLSAPNPFARLRYAPGADRLVVAEAGVFGALDGGLELIDPTDPRPAGLAIGEAALGGDLVDAVLLDPDRGYAIVATGGAGAQATTRVVRFDPLAGEVRAELLAADSYAHAALELSPDGAELWVADRTREAPGVRVFSTRGDEELTAAPISTGLPPLALCFVP